MEETTISVYPAIDGYKITRPDGIVDYITNSDLFAIRKLEACLEESKE